MDGNLWDNDGESAQMQPILPNNPMDSRTQLIEQLEHALYSAGAPIQLEFERFSDSELVQLLEHVPTLGPVIAQIVAGEPISTDGLPPIAKQVVEQAKLEAQTVQQYTQSEHDAQLQEEQQKLAKLDADLAPVVDMLVQIMLTAESDNIDMSPASNNIVNFSLAQLGNLTPAPTPGDKRPQREMSVPG
ncbi:MAG: hypothetical protein F6K62_10400 [Sphaerospermopsis sp. SIO1G2]|nr:hypothetical protein [Sphaerospermopsis sp. SIO1G2]